MLVALNMESITAADLYVFGDACIVASCAVVCAVVHQPKVKKPRVSYYIFFFL